MAPHATWPLCSRTWQQVQFPPDTQACLTILSPLPTKLHCPLYSDCVMLSGRWVAHRLVTRSLSKLVSSLDCLELPTDCPPLTMDISKQPLHAVIYQPTMCSSGARGLTWLLYVPELCLLKVFTHCWPSAASRLAARTRCQLGTLAGDKPCTHKHDINNHSGPDETSFAALQPAGGQPYNVSLTCHVPILLQCIDQPYGSQHAQVRLQPRPQGVLGPAAWL